MSQAALDAFASAKSESCNFPLLVDGVVVAVHYPDDADKHRCGFQIMYDVEPVSTPGLPVIPNAIFLRMSSGYQDGDEMVLRAASKNIDGSKLESDNNTGKHSNLLGTDGDRVIVGFLNGNFNCPVILGVLPHALSELELKDSYGNDFPRDKLIRRTSHRGTEVYANERGDVTVNFADHPEDKGVADKKQLKVHVGDLDVIVDNKESPSTVQIANKDGGSLLLKLDKDHLEVSVPDSVSLSAPSVTVDAGASGTVAVKGGTINLGDPATDPAVLGTKHIQSLTTLVMALSTYATAIAASADATGAATPPLIAAIIEFNVELNTTSLSRKVNVG